MKLADDRLAVRVLPFEKIDAHLGERWRRLETNARPGNPYLSIDFVLPALRNAPRDRRGEFVLVLVERGSAEPELLGLGVFEIQPGSRYLPLPHLRAFKTRNSFLTGLLVHSEFRGRVLRALFRYFRFEQNQWHGVHFTTLRTGALESELRMAASHFDVRWNIVHTVDRAELLLDSSSQQPVASRISTGRRRNLARGLRQLEKQGTVTWRFRRGAEIDDAAIESFLQLEHLGWKGLEHSSIRSDPGQEAFFKSMIKAFAARGDAFFTELCFNDVVIASANYLLAGDTGYAFKIAWDSKFARFSPGMLNELLFLRNAPEVLPGIRSIDSGASPGSFIESLWIDRCSMVSGVFTCSTLGHLAAWCGGLARRVKWALFAHSPYVPTARTSASTAYRESKVAVGRVQRKFADSALSA